MDDMWVVQRFTQTIAGHAMPDFVKLCRSLPCKITQATFRRHSQVRDRSTAESPTKSNVLLPDASKYCSISRPLPFVRRRPVRHATVFRPLAIACLRFVIGLFCARLVYLLSKRMQGINASDSKIFQRYLQGRGHSPQLACARRCRPTGFRG